MSIPKACTVKYGKQAFAYIALALYNKLPIEVRKSPTFNTFKSGLKLTTSDWPTQHGRIIRDISDGPQMLGEDARHTDKVVVYLGRGVLARGASASGFCAASLMHLGQPNPPLGGFSFL